MKKTISLFLSLATMFIFVACGGGSSGNTTGYLIDAPVKGVKYINANGKNGFTDEKGAFSYTGGTIKFYIGKIQLGSVSKLQSDKKVLIPEVLGLARTTGLDNTKLLNTVTFLQSLDKDPSNDALIDISENFNKFNQEKYNTHIEVANIDDFLSQENITKKDSTAVEKHFNDSMKKHIRPYDRREESKTSNTNTKTNEVSTFNQGSIAIDDNLEIQFAQKILKESLDDASISCVNTQSLSPCTIKTKKVDGKKLILEISDLNYSNTYKITIDNKLTDYANKSLARVVTFSTTADNSTQTPTVKRFEEKDSSILVIFSKKMSDDTINSTNINLISKDNQPVDISLSFDGKKTATITPSQTLITNATYKVIVSNNVKDINGLYLKNEATYSFTTKQEINHQGFAYKIIQSPITQRYWLDRNLGASAVCDSRYVGLNQEGKNNTACYGDYFQWGRKANGHEKKTSAVVDTTKNPIEKDVETNGKFATWGTVKTGSVKNSGDWRKFQNDDLWKGVNAPNNPCPTGFRVPTIDELLLETADVDESLFPQEKVTGGYETLQNFLKLPPAGFRDYKTRDGIVDADLSSYTGYVWSSTAGSDTSSGIKGSYALDFYPGGIYKTSVARAKGYSVRCIKDYSTDKPLTVMASSPSNGDTNVDVNATITIVFSKPTLIEYRSMFTIKDLTNNKLIGISIVKKISPTTYELPLNNGQAYDKDIPGSFNNKMRYNTKYQISFSKDIKDASGKSIVAEPISFTTEKILSEQNPKVLKSNVKNGATNVSRDENIRIYFTKDMEKATFTTENITLKSNNTPVAFTFDYKEIQTDKWDTTKKDRILTINPSTSLDSLKEYTLTLSDKIKDINDIALVEKTIKFTTKSSNDIKDEKGNIYQEVTSTRTSKVWLDRNLGASSVCTSAIDENCFGTYFEIGTQKDTLCPTGYKIPTYDELYKEFVSVPKSTLQSHFLKAPTVKLPGRHYELFLSSSTSGKEYETKKVLHIPTYLVEKDAILSNSKKAPIRCIKGK